MKLHPVKRDGRCVLFEDGHVVEIRRRHDVGPVPEGLAILDVYVSCDKGILQYVLATDLNKLPAVDEVLDEGQQLPIPCCDDIYVVDVITEDMITPYGDPPEHPLVN